MRPGAPAAAGLLLAASLGGARHAHALSWADLWSRPDQRAETLLESGKPAAAAPLFEDPAHRGYAELQAHDYPAAAKQLAAAKDPESAYNRGNALARSNQLSEALDAYDAALRQTAPDSTLHRDAQHNRDLVAKQLESQGGDKQQHADNGKGQGKSGDSQSQPRSDDGKNKPPQNAQNQNQNQNQDQNQDQQQNAGNKDAQQGQSAQGQGAQGQQPQNPGQQGQQDRQPPPAQAQQPGQQPQQGQAQNGSQEPPSSARNGDAGSPPEPPKDSAAKAEADARLGADAKREAEQRAAANAAAAKQGQQGPAPDSKTAQRAGVSDEKPKPETEQAMALDQWLRWIPDDPSGLLRRKFMIEHMEKQREQAQ